MKSFLIVDGKNWRFYAGFHRRLQGLGLVWEVDIPDTIKSERHQQIKK